MIELLESRRLFAASPSAGVVGDFLEVNGGSKADNIIIAEQTGGTTTVTINGVLLYTGTAGVDFQHVTVFSKGGGNDIINLGGHAAAAVNAGGGKDSITVQFGNSTQVSGGDGDDNITITEDNGSSQVDGGKGNDAIVVQNANNTLVFGGDGKDKINVITVNAAAILAAEIHGGNDNDFITLLEGQSYVTGDAGNDTIDLEGSATLFPGSSAENII